MLLRRQLLLPQVRPAQVPRLLQVPLLPQVPRLLQVLNPYFFPHPVSFRDGDGGGNITN